MSLAEPLLSRLQGIHKVGPDRWYARCPAHEDKAPSLSIRQTSESVLIHCFAGCDPNDILEAVNLKWTDLYPDRWEASKRAAFSTPTRSRKPQTKLMYCGVDIEVERTILALFLADMRAGRDKSIEDRARAEVARLRVIAADTAAREVA